MADYYTEFSFEMPVPNAEALAYALVLHRTGDDYCDSDSPVPDSVPKELHEFLETWDISVEAMAENSLWIHGSDVELACAFTQHLLQKFDPGAVVKFSWANACSKPCLDAFGGGAAIVTASDVKTMDTQRWLHETSYLQ